MKVKLGVTLAATLFASSVSAQTCKQDFDFVSPIGHSNVAASISTLKKGFGASAKGNFDMFMSIAADPYIQHSPDLPDGWKPVWDLLKNRPKGFSSKNIGWIGPQGFLNNGQYLVMFREVDKGNGEGPSKKFDLLYFDDEGKYAEHWDMKQTMAKTTASGRSEVTAAQKFTDNPVSYDQKTEESNRRLVTSFLNLAFNGGQLETALKLYASSDYIQHNPLIADGIQSAIDAFSSGTIPSPCYDIQFILAQNDLVWIYSKVTNSQGISAVVDLIRVRDGKMVEHWDVIEAVPEKMPHDNGFF